MSRLLEELQSGHVLLMDGAMGTELQRVGLRGICGESWNLTHPDRVRAIHRAYVESGAAVLLTNTFQAQREQLDRHGLAARFDDVWHAAIAHARSAAAGRAVVLADLGPFELASAFHEGKALATACASCDGVLVETLSEIRGGPVFLHFWAEKFEPRLPYLLSFTFRKTSRGRIETATSETPKKCAWQAAHLGVDAVGVNCGREIDIAGLAEVVREYRQQLGDRLPIFARPNAGTPTRVGSDWVYPRTPEMMADQLPELLEAGVNMVGGCCGTRPAHIAAFRRVVDDWNLRKGFTGKTR
jgi:5-methyltetrahydrofolate--homocysteine methyltransferase